MKRLRRSIYIPLVLLAWMMIAFPLSNAATSVLAETEPLKVNITLDRSSVTAGETLTANYTITGGSGVYKSISVLFSSTEHGIRANPAVTNHVRQGSTGYFSCVPRIGEEIKAYILIYDTEGQQVNKFSGSIPITGSEKTTPFQVSIILDKPSVAVGETLTAYYTINGGSGVYKSVSVLFSSTEYGGIKANPTVTKHVRQGSTGSFSCVPKIGEEIKAYILVYDTEGRQINKFSGSIPITGSEKAAPFQVSITLDKPSVTVGETLSANYAITGGSGIYKSISVLFSSAERGVRANPAVTDHVRQGSTGSFSCVPKIGEEIKAYILIYDTEGRQINKFSDSIPIVASFALNSVAAAQAEGSVKLTAEITGRMQFANYRIINGSGAEVFKSVTAETSVVWENAKAGTYKGIVVAYDGEWHSAETEWFVITSPLSIKAVTPTAWENLTTASALVYNVDLEGVPQFLHYTLYDMYGNTPVVGDTAEKTIRITPPYASDFMLAVIGYDGTTWSGADSNWVHVDAEKAVLRGLNASAGSLKLGDSVRFAIDMTGPFQFAKFTVYNHYGVEVASDITYGKTYSFAPTYADDYYCDVVVYDGANWLYAKTGWIPAR